jgi:hypothetical protein
MGYFLRGQAAASSSCERAQPIALRGGALGLTDALHAAALQRAAGFPFPGDPDGGYPTRDEGDRVPRLLRRDLGFPMELNSEVKRLDQATRGGFVWG